MNYAVIDLGSNTIRLSVYHYKDHKITAVIRQKEIAGLAGYIKNNRLAPEGIEKACDILNAFKEIAIRFVKKSEIYVFATASLRGILNQAQALERIHVSTGLLPDVLTGEEEARLDFIGASRFMECTEGILIDIGGASTELVRFQNAQPVQLASMPIGCLNLFAKFVAKVIPTDMERKAIKKEIKEQLRNIGWDEKETLPLMIGVGGTMRAAHKLSCSLFSIPKEQNEIKAVYIREILRELKHNENEIYHTVYRLIPERTLTISTGLLILHEAIKKFDSDTIFISNYGVREGYFIDRILKESDAVRCSLSMQ